MTYDLTTREGVRAAREDIFPAVVERLQFAGTDAEYRPDYSGRGMFGETTPAIVCDDPHLLGATIAIVAMDEFDIAPGDVTRITPGRQDSMALSRVFY